MSNPPPDQEPDREIVYVNGQFTTAGEAMISIFDRGFLFADGVYEVCSVLGGKLVDNEAHLQRLQRSLAGLAIAMPQADIPALQRTLVARNALEEGIVYLQVTRGVAKRDFNFPKGATPSLIMFTQIKSILDNPAARTGLKIISLDDIRWKRRDLKTISLLAQSLAKETAASRGADDAWMVEDGYVTEGSSNNTFIITPEGVIITRHLGNEILHGITRKVILHLAGEENLVVEERAFTLAEAYRAKEAFITSAASFVLPVVSIDGHKIGDGMPGALTQNLRRRYIEFALDTAC